LDPLVLPNWARRSVLQALQKADFGVRSMEFVKMIAGI